MSHGERRALSPRRGRAEREALIDINNPIHVLQPAQPNGLSIYIHIYVLLQADMQSIQRGRFPAHFVFMTVQKPVGGVKGISLHTFNSTGSTS